MKKIIVLMFTVIFVFSSVVANAATTDFLYETYTNYTSTGTMTMSLDNSEDLVKRLEELEMPEEVNNFVDLKALLKSIFSQSATMKVQADISDDYSKAEIAVTGEAQSKIEANKNLKIGLDLKTGMWLKMDLKNEVFTVIYSNPYLNKYMVVDLFEIIPDEETKAQILGIMKMILNKDTIESIQKFSADMLKKHAEIKMSGSKCTVKFDNESFISMMDEVMSYVMNIMSAVSEEAAYMELPSFEGLKILGDKGITYTYSFASGKPKSVVLNADFAIDLSLICNLIMGYEWEGDSPSVLKFTLKEEYKFSKYGKTKVDFPKLTEENSFSLKDMIPEPYPGDEDYIPYPYYYVDEYNVEKLPVFEGEIYVPLRQTLVSAYDETVVIGYDNGVITASCDYFPGFKELKLSVGSTTAYLDGQQYEISKIYAENGTTFVSYKMFEELFGWEFTYASYDMLSDSFEYTFYTNKYE